MVLQGADFANDTNILPKVAVSSTEPVLTQYVSNNVGGSNRTTYKGGKRSKSKKRTTCKGGKKTIQRRKCSTFKSCNAGKGKRRNCRTVKRCISRK